MNVCIRGISRLGSHCKAGVAGGDGMERWALVPRWQRWDRGGKPRSSTQQGPALPLPCRTLCTRLGNVLLNPLCLPQPPRATLVQQKAPRPASLIFRGLPTQLPALLCLWNPAEGSRWQIPPDSPPEPPGQGISGHCTLAGDKPWPRWRCCIPGLPRHWADT